MINQYDENKCFDYENGFYLTSDVYRMGNIMSHYELYKRITNLPGDVIELGVFKGSSFIQFASFRELLENEKSRNLIGFDAFGEFPAVSAVESDKRFVSGWNYGHQGSFLSKDELEQSLAHKHIMNFDLIQGDIAETLPAYLKAHPQMKIALLHIDVDVYEPSKLGLELLYPRMVKGGIIILDDYGTVEGETLAVDEFFKDKDIKIEKFPFSHGKPSFIVI